MLEGHSWAHLNSFPSGHMAITAALATGAAIAFPRARLALGLYVAAVAFTRVLFGAHFPFDTVAGTALGVASALLVAVALDRGSKRGSRSDASSRPRLEADDVVAVMPSYEDVPSEELLEGVRAQVGTIVVVDDGSSPSVARQLDAAAASVGATLVRQPTRSGKGSAVRAGIDAALEAHPGLRAVMVVDADGQHPPAAIAEFVAAADSADLVIGDRFADLASMPFERRLANRTTRRLFGLVSGHPVRDTQNGMRLLRRDALELVPRRRLRGGDDAPAARAPRGTQRRVGADAGDLWSGAELVPSGSGLGGGAVGAGATARTTVPATAPIATPSRLPTSTSDRKCTPRYTRDTATSAASASSGRLSRGWTIPTATAAANAVAA